MQREIEDFAGPGPTIDRQRRRRAAEQYQPLLGLTTQQGEVAGMVAKALRLLVAGLMLFVDNRITSYNVCYTKLLRNESNDNESNDNESNDNESNDNESNDNEREDNESNDND